MWTKINIFRRPLIKWQAKSKHWSSVFQYSAQSVYRAAPPLAPHLIFHCRPAPKLVPCVHYNLQFAPRASVFQPSKKRKGSVIAFQTTVQREREQLGRLIQPEVFAEPGSFFWLHVFDWILITCCQSAAENTLICLFSAAVTQLPKLCRESNFTKFLFLFTLSLLLFSFCYFNFLLNRAAMLFSKFFITYDWLLWHTLDS